MNPRGLRRSVLLAVLVGLISTSAPVAAQALTIWPSATTPQRADSDKSAVEVGVRFRSDVAGTISGIRFYKYAGNTGVHIGTLWTNSGTKLATATFAGETSSGWQQVLFASPVTIAADTTYVASYHTNVGRYGVTDSYFATAGYDRAPLHALRSGVDGANGVYRYGSASAFPDQTFQSANYWVDVVFTAGTIPTDTTPPTAMAGSPADHATAVGIGSNVTATFSEAMTASTINATTFELRDAASALVPASVTYDNASLTATLDPAATLAYATTHTATVKTGVKDLAGNAMTAAVTWSFTTAEVPPPPPPPSSCPCTIWNASTDVTTRAIEDGDTSAVDVGVRFQADTAGYITGLRFYKFAGNTGVHVGNLWTSAGTLLGSATFISESATGWQQVALASPVAVTANTTYVASYHTTGGHYASSNDYFAVGVDNAPLHALRDGVNGPNGVYRYASTATFPDQTYQSANYWVDVVFNTSLGPDTTPPTVSSTTPMGSATNVSIATVVTATFSEMMASPTISATTFELRDAAGNLVQASVTPGGETPTATLTPASPLAYSTTYTASVKGGDGGATDVAGNAMTGPYSWSFTTAAAPPPPPPPGACPCSIWSLTTTPAIGATDPSPVEVGVRFRSDTAGYITNLRFYKVVGNTGIHVGNLWTSTGTLLARATFTGETAVGWQEVTLASPVAITANTTYVASYHTDTGHYAVDNGYFGSAVDKAPLHALRDGVDGPNGIYQYGSASTFPNQTYQSANYWVDVVFNTVVGPEVTPPVVSSVTPSAGAIGIGTTRVVTATFSEMIAAATVNTSTFQLRDAAGTLIPASVLPGGETPTASLTPTTALGYSTTYTATLKGGAGGVKDLAGNPMVVDYTWSFTTAAAPLPPGSCPCTIWDDTASPAGPDNDGNAVELGVKFQSDVDGYITGLRFFKFQSNTGTHVGDLWTRAGARLATATFTGETASGWQQVTFSSPVAITAGTTYMASYHTTVGRYAVNSSYFTSAVAKPPLRALADGADGGNGVYSYGPSGSFPTQTYHAANYWVDAVFVSTLPDTTAPYIMGLSPGTGSGGGASSANVIVNFSEPMAPATITTTTFELRDPSGNLVPATVTYNDALRSATLDPIGALAYSTTYAAVVKGGASSPRVTDVAGNSLAANASWLFTTGAAPTVAPGDGPGGPILVVSSTSNPFSRYYAEILRAEGLNAFAVADISGVSATSLSAYDVVILGEMPLTAAQVTMFTDWVTAGGNLIAMRPDKQLATLLGLIDQTSTLSNAYLVVDGSTGPGSGIATGTMQFRGTADAYTAGSATSVATLYAAPSSATPNPAVTLNSVGVVGGHAAAFTYDLARSIVYTRQGDPAFSGQERDAVSPITSGDLLFGAQNTIPQADEQQRLFANLVLRMNRDRKPLPRFWYFPRGVKAVVVMTGDEHGGGGEAGRFDGYKAASPAGCSVAGWECIRSTAYVSPATPLGNSTAAAYAADGFDIAVQVDTGCADWTPASLQTFYTNHLVAFATQFPGLPAQATHRVRCSVWSDYGTQPQIELGHGIRLDTSYAGQSFFTGSGMPMRFADATGALVDVYQAATQLTDDSGQSYPFAIDTLLDKALGAEGYYGAFTANMQADSVYSLGSDQIVASAKAHGVPVIAARQLLDWVDGRNGSWFQALAWNGTSLTFSIAVGVNANGLQAMLPATVTAGTLTTLTLNGNPVAFTTQTIKGIDYVLFPAWAGTYRANYAP